MDRILLVILSLGIAVASCNSDDSISENNSKELGLTYVYIGDVELSTSLDNKDVKTDQVIEIRFDKSVDVVSVEGNIRLMDATGQDLYLEYSFLNENKLLKVHHETLHENAYYRLVLSDELQSFDGAFFGGLEFSFLTFSSPLIMKAMEMDSVKLNPLHVIKDVSRDPSIVFKFNSSIAANDLADYLSFSTNNLPVGYHLTQVDDKTVSFSANQKLMGYKKYQLRIASDIESRIGKSYEGLDFSFYTALDSTYKFPEISDDELLTKIQAQTFKYFWDFAHPVSGLIRERNSSGETVTSGGSGFGLMAMVVGMERGFISRSEGVEQLHTIIDFLGEADRFHGAWPHWLNGTTGKVIPFSQKDDGGDLVETSFVAAGLLTVRQYLDSTVTNENSLIAKINDLMDGIQWDWYTRGGQNVLYWHWSPNYNWDMNMQIKGYNEALLSYVMAASSQTHSIAAEVYHQGWANNGAIVNGESYYDMQLPLGTAMGGPLFLAHYSFLGLDPRNLSDTYANYWDQNRSHTLINRAYCLENPQGYVSYSQDCWGITASDNQSGYSAHSPTNDRGVISPTAAISSLPYTPEESMQAIRFFYYMMGDQLWGAYGFYDAFNVTEDWVADSYLAIDQGL